jgi:predicted deacylase
MKTGVHHEALKFEKWQLPAVTVKGACEGPTLVVIGMQHITEYSGPAAFDRVLAEVNPRELRGTLVVLPFVNPIQINYSPARKRTLWKSPTTNMNRLWPGDSASTNELARLTAFIWETFLRRADAVIDYHCCRTVDPRFAATLDGHRPSRAFALAMGLELLDLQTDDSYAHGLLFTAAARELNIPAALIENHPGLFQMRESVESGASALWRSMVHLGMLESWEPYPAAAHATTIVRRSDAATELHASHAGYVGVRKWAGERVAKGNVVAVVRSMKTFEVLEELRSPVTGVLCSVGVTTDRPVARSGDIVATVKRATR